MATKITVTKFNEYFEVSRASLFGCLYFAAVIGLNFWFSNRTILHKKYHLQLSFTLCPLWYKREFLCNTLNKIISSNSPTQFTLIKNSLISCYSQRLIQTIFVVQLQTFCEIPHRKILLENLTSEH